MQSVTVVAHPRIHVGLVDLAHASARCFAGVGFSIDAHDTIWQVRESSRVEFVETASLDEAALEQLQGIGERLGALSHGGFAATLHNVAKQHVGFGTKTTLSLALITAVNVLKGLELTAAQIQAVSGRGGASGAGCHLFYTGGVVWDGGHKWKTDIRHLPSGAQRSTQVPPLLGRWEFPTEWQVGLLLPPGIQMAGVGEEQFFSENTPTPRIEALETMAIVYHGIVPALAMTDIVAFGDALRDLHKVGFKRREVAGQSKVVGEMLDYLQQSRAGAAGMSSLGPLLYYVFARDDSDAVRFMESACAKFDAMALGAASGSNEAHSVTIE